MKKYILSLILIVPFLFSCNDWLDISPKTQVLEEDLLKDRKGYSAALAGIYFNLTDGDAYGGRLSFGFTDVLGQYWIPKDMLGASAAFYNYDYKSTQSISMIDSFWSNLYGIIGGSNLIIASIEKNGGSIEHANWIEGEALGIRALAHFELFRLFGPVLLESGDLSKECIIYRKKFNNEYVEFSTTEEVLGEIKNDLLKAKDLLHDDPIRVSGGRSDNNPSMLNFNDILYYRVSRMNYYAVVGLLIRLEMYLDNKDQAYAYIEELLEEFESKKDVEKHIKFVDVSTMINNTPYSRKDIPFSCEFLFSIYSNDLYERTKSIFGNQGWGSGELAVDNTAATHMINNVYVGVKYGSAADIRFKCWFKHTGLVNSITEIQKFLPAEQVNTQGSGESGSQVVYAYQSEIGYITLGEIYLTALECQIGKNNKLAIQYLNTLRQARNLDALDENVNYSTEELVSQLLIESKKEYLASGRLFHLYKRLYRPIPMLNGNVVQPSRDIFELPIPKDEIEYKK